MIKTPWLSSYGKHNFNLTYPEMTISEKILDTAEKYPNMVAFSFMGKKTTYKEFVAYMIKTAKAFKALGIEKDEIVTICMPNSPQGVIALYALNYIGAIASMIHPLSAESEIVFYVNEVKSRYLLTLDQFFPVMKEVKKSCKDLKFIISSIKDALSPIMKFGFSITQGRKFEKVKESNDVILWSSFLNLSSKVKDAKVNKDKDDCAIILFSGGTSGVSKGILLSNHNMNALAYQTIEMSGCPNMTGKVMLAAMPIFHGFGLGVCVHTMFCCGGRSILVPRFNVKSYAKLVVKEKPNFIAGVPSLYEALTRADIMKKADLSHLLGVFSGGDVLSIELKKKLDVFLKDHNASIRVREGYGLTECVTASCLTPIIKEKEGSIGIPYPDTYYKICKLGTTDEVEYGEDGEICLAGETVMLGYLNNKKETEDTLKLHSDGKLYLHTGDLGYMDSQGYIYFKQRIKRMIITNGYNVYPAQLENILEQHEAVQVSCVIGVKDSKKMQKVKAFVVLKQGYTESPEVISSIFDHCKKNIAKYMLPYEIEVKKELPKTKVGKIAYTVLEDEENSKLV